MGSKQTGLSLQAGLRKEVQQPDIRLIFVPRWMKGKVTHVFPTDLPARLRLVKALRCLISVRTKTNHNVALDGPQASDHRGTSRARHRPDSDLERSTCRSGAIVCQLSVVQVTLEEDEIRSRQMKEQIGGLRVKIPEGVPCAPERVLLVHPFAFLFVLLKVEFRNLAI